MDGIHAVYCKAIGLGKRLFCEPVPGREQTGESAALPTDPQFVAAAGDRVDTRWPPRPATDTAETFCCEPVEPALDGGEPGAVSRVGVDRAVAPGRQAFGRGIRDEGAVTEALDAARAAGPEIALAIFEEPR